MRYLIGLFVGMFLMIACGSGPSSISEYIIDVKAQMLRGPKPKDDKPLNYCDSTVCYAYTDADVRLIKKYIIELEERLKACEKH